MTLLALEPGLCRLLKGVVGLGPWSGACGEGGRVERVNGDETECYVGSRS